MNPETEYTPRELDAIFNQLNDKLDENLRVSNITLAQAQKTNGRVTLAENEISSLKNWRSATVASIAIITGFVVPLVIYIFIYQTNNLESQLKELKEEIRSL